MPIMFRGCNVCDAFLSEADLMNRFVGQELWTWGCGGVGILGTNSTNLTSSPVQTIAGGTNWNFISLGADHTTALKTDGTLWVWGCNGSGRLGDNTLVNKSSPVQTIGSATNWKAVSGGFAQTIAIKTDGTLWSWGFNSTGQLGDNTTTTRSSPVQTISAGANWLTAAAGTHNGAIKTDGTLWNWGCGAAGDLGNDSTINHSSPVQTIAGGTNWRNISAGSRFFSALKTDGTLWIWGTAGSGRLGNVSTINRSSPVQTVSGGTNWKKSSLGSFHSSAIKTDGTLWSWGFNGFGQLGDNTTTNKSSPIQTISQGNNWRGSFTGGCHTLAIKTDGTLWLLGIGTFGHLGNDNAISMSSPVQTVSGGTNWRSASGGCDHSGGLRLTGE
jgi:alpha-tubulin suppressor-like RCC1 family protein